MADKENAENKDVLNEDSRNIEDSPSEMLQPWMKTLGKKYYSNETLGKYEKLTDAVDALLERPEKKHIPSEYGIREGFDELYRSSGLTKEEAEKIDSEYSKLIPKKKPDLKDVFKEEYDDTMKLYADGVKSISDDLAKDIKDAGLDKDPVFVKILARVGKETGGEPFVEEKKTSPMKERPSIAAVKRAYSIKE